MIASLEKLGTVYTQYLGNKIIASFLCLDVNLILDKIINRVKFVYLSELKKVI